MNGKLIKTLFVVVATLLLGCSEPNARIGGDVLTPSTDDPSDTDSDTNTDSSTDSNNSDTDSSGEDSDPVTPDCEDEDEFFCLGECRLLNTELHCGVCDRRCPAGTVCVEDGDDYRCDCGPGTIVCGTKCVDPFTDPDYCGAQGTCTGVEAGFVCGDGGQCVDARCECLPNYTSCDDTCVDTLADPDYCGSTPDECGIQCPANGVCATGACQCTFLHPTECDNLGCVNTETDNGACGGCVEDGGEVCDTANGFTCTAGVCACPAGLTDCGGQCVDLNTDPDHCGACTGPTATCGWVVPDTVREGCFAGTCVADACDPLVMGDVCQGAGVLQRTNANCTPSDDHFVTGGMKCHNDGNGLPMNTAACYTLSNVPATYNKFRSWWSGRAMTVNGMVVVSNDSGTNYTNLPSSVSGSYCVYIPASAESGHMTDGFAIGIQ